MICETDFYKNILDNLPDGVYLVGLDRKITYWNRAAEKITGYSADEVVGSHCFNNVLRHVSDRGEKLCDGLCPLARTIEDGVPREQEIFLHHKDGHRVPVQVRVSPVTDDDGAITGAVEIFSDSSRQSLDLDAMDELKRLAMIDPLTGLGNRRYGEMALHTRVDELSRYGVPFGLLFIDIDKFKRINDSFGHDVGDEVLRMLARTSSGNLRAHDAIARWGGEEFVALITHVSSPEQLLAIAEKLRALLDHSSISSGDDIIHVTISIGATMARPGDDEDSIIKRADELMYEAKKLGGNRVEGDAEPDAEGKAAAKGE